MMEENANQSAGNGDWMTTKDMQQALDSAAASLEDLDRRVRPWIGSHPFLAVGLAAAAGFLLGRLVSRA